MAVGGTYNFVVQSPMGEQTGTCIVVPDDTGNGFSGQLSGGMGTMAIEDGTISGNSLSWQMDMTVPMPITLDCEATVEGDAMTGTIKAGMMGSMPFTALRQD